VDDAQVGGDLEHYNKLRLNSAAVYINPNTMLAGCQQEIRFE
jgi:hypothetical protein